MNLRKILSLYEIVFGIIGIGMLALFSVPQMLALRADVTAENQSTFFLLIGVCVAVLIFYILAILAGTLLFLKRRSGKILSIILEIVQIPVVILGGVKFYLSLGLTLMTYLTFADAATGFRLKFILGPQFSFSTGEVGLLLGVNVGAIILLVLFMMLKDENSAISTRTTSS